MEMIRELDAADIRPFAEGSVVVPRSCVVFEGGGVVPSFRYNGRTYGFECETGYGEVIYQECSDDVY